MFCLFNETFQRMFDFELFSSTEPTCVTDQWVKKIYIFDFFQISPSYSKFRSQKPDFFTSKKKWNMLFRIRIYTYYFLWLCLFWTPRCHTLGRLKRWDIIPWEIWGQILEIDLPGPGLYSGEIDLEGYILNSDEAASVIS